MGDDGSQGGSPASRLALFPPVAELVYFPLERSLSGEQCLDASVHFVGLMKLSGSSTSCCLL